MFNLKASAIAAGAAFILSALIGLIGGAGFLAVLFRATLLAAAFFGFAAAAYFLISRFLPDLLGAQEPMSEDAEAIESDRVGGAVDLSVGDDEDALPIYSKEEFGDPSSSEEGSGLDHAAEGGYTEAEEILPATESESNVSAAVPARPPEFIGDVDILPDLEGLSDAFVTPISMDESDSGASRPPVRPSSGGGAGGAGQFDSKEMAMAIQTILKRDQKG